MSVDPLIEPEVMRSKARANYFRRAAESEVHEAVKHPHGSKTRAKHESKAREFYFKCVTAEDAVKRLSEFFETPPATVVSEPQWMQDVEASLQLQAFQNAVASFPEPLIILSVTESGHIMCPDGECVGWVR